MARVSAGSPALGSASGRFTTGRATEGSVRSAWPPPIGPSRHRQQGRTRPGRLGPIGSRHRQQGRTRPGAVGAVCSPAEPSDPVPSEPHPGSGSSERRQHRDTVGVLPIGPETRAFVRLWVGMRLLTNYASRVGSAPSAVCTGIDRCVVGTHTHRDGRPIGLGLLRAPERPRPAPRPGTAPWSAPLPSADKQAPCRRTNQPLRWSGPWGDPNPGAPALSALGPRG